jgi:hypothetical protein
MIVRGYTLDLYCENARELYGTGSDGDIHDYKEFPATYVGETRQECVRAARKEGWTINITEGKCICPKCNHAKNVVRTFPQNKWEVIKQCSKK